MIDAFKLAVAIARYVTFAALALHKHSEYWQKLADEDDYAELFVQEVHLLFVTVVGLAHGCTPITPETQFPGRSG